MARLHPSSIKSNSLPDGLDWSYWRDHSRALYFLCTTVLSSCWDDKFQNFGLMHRYICKFLSPWENKSSRKFLSVFRGSFKTTILLGLVIYLICWSLADKKPISIMYNTATKENAEAFMEDVRQTLLNCKLLHWIFPELPTVGSGYKRWTMKKVEFASFKFHVASLDTVQVSRHYTVLINDDLVNDENAYSETERKNVLRKWRMQKSILTRYRRLKVGWEYDVGTPYDKADLVAHIINNVSTYHKFILPYRIKDDHGAWALAFPELYDWEDFDLIRQDQGESIFSTQYDLKVLDSQSGIAKEEWLQDWKFLPDIANRYLIIDPAGTESRANDPTGFLTADVDQKGFIYFVDAKELWLTPYKMLKTAEALQTMHDPDETFMEKEKYSITLADTVDHLAPSFNFSFVEHKNQPKEKRIHRLKQYFETKRIFFGPGMENFKRQVLDYPDGDHDDLLDCAAHLLKVMQIPTKKASRERNVVRDQTDFEEELRGNAEKMGRLRQRENYDATF